jgi:hypothetical protein
MIKKVTGGKYELRTKDGRKRLGVFTSRRAALKRERQIQFFKQKGG